MGGDSLKVLTDDAIDSFVLDLHDYIVRFPLTYTEEGYDHLYEYVHQRLEQFSNGYRNYN